MRLVAPKLFWPLLSTSLLVATQVEGQSTVDVCARSSKDSDFMEFELRIAINLAPAEIAPVRLSNNCLRVLLPTCDDTVEFVAKSGRFYAGSGKCDLEASPNVIALGFNSELILNAAFTPRSNDQTHGIALLAQAVDQSAWDPITSEPAQSARERMLASIQASHFAEAHILAKSISQYYEDRNDLEAATAYGQLADIAGFRAIGVEPLSKENPMVSASDSGFVGLSEQGRNVIRLYQAENGLGTNSGGWDDSTSFALGVMSGGIDQGGSFERNPIVPPPNPSGIAVDGFGRAVQFR